MLRDITIGQYYPVDSPVHRLDPRVKIVATILFMVLLFVVKDALGLILCGVVLAGVVKASRVPLSFILRGLGPIMILLLFTIALNIFMVDGRILWSYGILKVTEEGLRMALFMGTRLIMIVIGASLLTFTTTPIKLTDGIERLLSPIEKIGGHPHELAMMMSIALRFIPTLTQETDKIIKAQQSRGADFDSGSIFARAKALVPVVIPLFVSAFRIAADLAMAMEARGYRGGEGRTRMNPLRMGRAEACWIAGMVVFAAAVIAERVVL